MHGDIVDAVVHQVFADSVMPAGQKGDLQLGPHAIGGTNQDRLAESGDLEGGAERPDIGQHIARERLARQLLDGCDGPAGFVDIDAGVSVTDRSGLRQISVYDPEYFMRMRPLSRAFVDAVFNPASRDYAIGTTHRVEGRDSMGKIYPSYSSHREKS